MAESNANAVAGNANAKPANKTGRRMTPTPTPKAVRSPKRNGADANVDSEEDRSETFEITSVVADIGIIQLPDGRHIILAVYINDSVSDGSTREHVIADIAKAVCERWTTGQFPDPSQYRSNSNLR